MVKEWTGLRLQRFPKMLELEVGGQAVSQDKTVGGVCPTLKTTFGRRAARLALLRRTAKEGFLLLASIVVYGPSPPPPPPPPHFGGGGGRPEDGTRSRTCQTHYQGTGTRC